MLITVWLFATSWTVAHQAPLYMGFSRLEYSSELSFPPPGDLPNPGIELLFPVLTGRFFTTNVIHACDKCLWQEAKGHQFSGLFCEGLRQEAWEPIQSNTKYFLFWGFRDWACPWSKRKLNLERRENSTFLTWGHKLFWGCSVAEKWLWSGEEQLMRKPQGVCPTATVMLPFPGQGEAQDVAPRTSQLMAGGSDLPYFTSQCAGQWLIGCSPVLLTPHRHLWGLGYCAHFIDEGTDSESSVCPRSHESVRQGRNLNPGLLDLKGCESSKFCSMDSPK